MSNKRKQPFTPSATSESKKKVDSSELRADVIAAGKSLPADKNTNGIVAKVAPNSVKISR